MESKEHFKDLFGEFIWERINLAISKESETPAEAEAAEEESQLFHKIKELLGEENFRLLLDYESAASYSGSIETEKAYRQGVRDGMLFKEELGI